MLKKKDPRGDLGKWAEASVNRWLSARSGQQFGFAYHRYPDARAARGALTAQPSDFLVAVKTETRRVALHLEVKETAQKIRLPRAKVSQYGALRLFEGAGIRALVVVYRSHHDDWTYFTGNDLFVESDEPLTSFPFVPNRSFPDEKALLSFLFDQLNP